MIVLVLCVYVCVRVCLAGGITERNLRRVLDETGASEFHASASGCRDTNMSYVNAVVQLGRTSRHVDNTADVTHVRCADRDRVHSLVSIARQAAF